MKASGYPVAWDRHLPRFQGEPVTVLEIGVHWGGSLELWRTYFGERATIVGVDIVEDCKAHEGDRIHVRIGDQSDREFLGSLVDEFGPFDVVMDDGGHTMAQQITTFEVLYSHVKIGGVYMCEDAGTSYREEFGGGGSGTFVDLMKAKVDELHAFHAPGMTPSEFTRTAASLHFYPDLVVIEKAEMAPSQFMWGQNGEIGYADVFTPNP